MKIVAEFDTNTKKLTCTMDGSAVADLQYVSMGPSYRENGDFCCELTTAIKDEENDCWKLTRVVASESIEGKFAKANHTSKESKLPGFIELPTVSKVEADIQKCFE